MTYGLPRSVSPNTSEPRHQIISTDTKRTKWDIDRYQVTEDRNRKRRKHMARGTCGQTEATFVRSPPNSDFNLETYDWVCIGEASSDADRDGGRGQHLSIRVFPSGCLEGALSKLAERMNERMDERMNERLILTKLLCTISICFSLKPTLHNLKKWGLFSKSGK